ncbi:MAG: hypothetical protein FJ314_09280 [SAR202 cluster bacterium]|nr:hypothetical protein [SAR202 cluster bacterium]
MSTGPEQRDSPIDRTRALLTAVETGLHNVARRISAGKERSHPGNFTVETGSGAARSTPGY